MKKAIRLLSMIMIIAMFGALAGCATTVVPTTAATTAAATTEAVATEKPEETYPAGRDYPDKELWYDKSNFGGAINAYGIFQMNGSEGFDVDAFVESEMGEKLLQDFKNSLCLYQDNMDPALVAYWEALDVEKKMHDDADPTTAWASYTPYAALEESNTALYPVVFCFHGNSNTILHAEGFGFALLGATENFITVIPDCNNSDGATASAAIPEILDTLEADGYPIDRSRVYLTGMSKGGMCCAYVSLEIPEIVTAIAMHGSAFALNPDAMGKDGVTPMGFPVTMYDKAINGGFQVPMYLAVGEYDLGQLPLNNEGMMKGINLRLQMNGIDRVLTLEECNAAMASGTDEAAAMTGLASDNNYVETIDGSKHYFAEYNNADGVTMIKIIGIENQPHWTTASYAEMAWAYMSQFSKVDGQLIVE